MNFINIRKKKEEFLKFDYICDDLPDGLVLMDKVYFDELNEDMLYSFEIMLDREGKKYAVEKQLFVEFCPKMVESATVITEKLMNS